ncbi:MAG: ParB/RepB/Spo0J family partition protein [Brevinematales bacterium]|nr:ParB/RepB/Spo0J family partition protein [Brevinematales bacterium]
MKERGLGKGLKSLLEDFDLTENSGVKNVSITSLKPNPNQPRKVFNETTLKELADSIKEKGILQPIVVREKGNYYEIIAGERRWRAAQMAGLTEVPIVIRNDISDVESLELALIENIQREDLNPIDLANAYNELIEKYNLSQEELSKIVGKSRSAIANTLRLLKLPNKVKEYIVQGILSEGHGRALLSLDSEKEILELAKECIEKNLSVREVEEIVSFRKNEKLYKETTQIVSHETKKSSLNRSTEIKNIEEDLIESLGTKVSVLGNFEKGKIIINYYSREDLERIYDIIVNKKPSSQY